MSSLIIPNGNICLTFQEPVSQSLIKFANKYLAGIADGYLIGPHNIPHLTLCKIHHDKPQPRALRRELGDIRVTPEAFLLADLAPRADTRDGYTWMNLTLAPTPQWLADLKDQVTVILNRYEITILTPNGPDYRPHVTIGRVKTASKSLGTDAMKFKIDIDPNQTLLSVGGSDADGQMQKVYWKKPLV